MPVKPLALPGLTWCESGKLKVESLYYQGKFKTIDELKRLMEP